MPESVSPKKRWLGIVNAIVLPTLVTWAYFDLLADSWAAVQQGTYSVGKIVQFAFPVVWILWGLKQQLRTAGLASVPDGQPQGEKWGPVLSIGFGVVMGLAVAAAMFVIYRFAFPADVVANLQAEVVDRVSGFAIDAWWKFLALSLFYAFGHSLLEEYYYRWFIFGQLRHVVKPAPAIIISGLAFMAHHVILLSHFFGGLTLFTLLLSSAIAIGGMIWAWQYEKSRSLIGPWISHLFIDAGIFAIGYTILSEANVI